MLDWIVEYWITFVFGLIVLLLTTCGKKIWNGIKSFIQTYIKKQCDEQLQVNNTSIQSAIKDLCEENRKQNQDIKDIHQSLLIIQGVSFKAYCRQLLRDDHQITLEEFENCQEEYEAYHGLGGNGRGTMLFELVKKKAQDIILDKEKNRES